MDYKDDKSPIGDFLKDVFGLAFLAPEDVAQYFISHVILPSPDDDRITNGLRHIFKTYVKPSAPFPPVLWATNDMDAEAHQQRMRILP